MGRTSYHKISWSLEAATLGLDISKRSDIWQVSRQRYDLASLLHEIWRWGVLPLCEDEVLLYHKGTAMHVNLSISTDIQMQLELYNWIFYHDQIGKCNVWNVLENILFYIENSKLLYICVQYVLLLYMWKKRIRSLPLRFCRFTISPFLRRRPPSKGFHVVCNKSRSVRCKHTPERLIGLGLDIKRPTHRPRTSHLES